MVTQKHIYSFFTKKRDEPIVEEQQPLIVAPLIELECRRQDEQQQADEQVVFQGIEFLERDPAKRPQIWEYPSNQQDEVRRAYLKLGPMQPKLQNYKASGPQGHQRRFQYRWFSEFSSWLEYLESSGCAYCLFCFIFRKT
uniref:TTF-type domain-containing protein n=1 Tax=Arundo donax TaxID=35708 RepID=A0A0A9H4Z9_ARUDO